MQENGFSRPDRFPPFFPFLILSSSIYLWSSHIYAQRPLVCFSPSLESLDPPKSVNEPQSPKKRASSDEIWNQGHQPALLISSNRLIWCPVYVMTDRLYDLYGTVLAEREHLPEAMLLLHSEHLIPLKAFYKDHISKRGLFPIKCPWSLGELLMSILSHWKLPPKASHPT